jgi:hypothetical protein
MIFRAARRFWCSHSGGSVVKLVLGVNDVSLPRSASQSPKHAARCMRWISAPRGPWISENFATIWRADEATRRWSRRHASLDAYRAALSDRRDLEGDLHAELDDTCRQDRRWNEER